MRDMTKNKTTTTKKINFPLVEEIGSDQNSKTSIQSIKSVDKIDSQQNQAKIINEFITSRIH